MTLINFTLENPVGTIALRGLNRYWDLHNFAFFKGFLYLDEVNRFELEWSAPRVGNPWGDDQNKAVGCKLIFTDVTYLSIGGAWTRLARSQECLSSVFQVTTEERNVVRSPELRTREKWNPTDDFALLFCLQSGRTIEVQSVNATLVAEDEIQTQIEHGK